MNFKMIVACDLQGVIGIDNQIPWKCSTDMKHFKEKTSGCIVVMGRKTFESMGSKPLPNRFNIVITRQPEKYNVDNEHKNLVFTNGFKNSDKVKADLGLLIGIALLTSKGDIESLDTVWFIGGESIYKDYIDLCSEVWVTVMKFDSLKVFLAPVENVLEVKEKVSFFSPLVKRIHHYNYYEVALYTQPSGFTLDHCLELAQENEPKNFEIRKYVRV